MERVENGRVSAQRILQELQAIGFASATDYMAVEEEKLVIRSTRELTKQQAASIAAIAHQPSSGTRHVPARQAGLLRQDPKRLQSGGGAGWAFSQPEEG